MKILAILLLVFGEALSILAEALAARQQSSLTFGQNFARTFPLCALGAALLISGYIVGYKSFKSVWVIMAVSTSAIVLIEPALGYGLFHELPRRGALLGFFLGICGLVATFWE